MIEMCFFFFYSFANKTYLLRCHRFQSSSCNSTSIVYTHRTKYRRGTKKKKKIVSENKPRIFSKNSNKISKMVLKFSDIQLKEKKMIARNY